MGLFIILYFFKHPCSLILFSKMQATYLSTALYLLSSITLLTEI